MVRIASVITAVVLGIAAVMFAVPVLVAWDYVDEVPWIKAFFIPAGILALLSALEWRKAYGAKGLGPSAPIGIGTLLRVERTGMSINDVYVYRLVLDVQTHDGQRFQGALRETFFDHEMAEFKPGSLIPVVYDPSKPHRLELPGEDRQEEAARVLMHLRVQMGLNDPRAPEIAANGVETLGVVMARVPTGQVRQGHTELEVTVRFTRLDGRTVERQKKVWLMPIYLSQLEPGLEVVVQYLPHDDTQLNIGISTMG